jgi:VCBS repeat-containing protein
VTNVNNAPVIGGVNAAAVTEDIDPDTDGQLEVSGALTIADPDAGESSFQAGTVAGTYGSLTIDAAGDWSYAADNSQAAIQQLDAGESVTDMLTVTTADGTTHTITITINGAEDTPVINDLPGPVDEGGGDPGPEDEVDPIEDDPEPDEEPSIDDELPTAEDVAVPRQQQAGAPGTTPFNGMRPRNTSSTIAQATPEYVYQTDDGSGSIAERLLYLLEREPASPSEGMIAPIATVFFSPEVMAQVLDHLQKQIDDTVELEANQGKLIVGAAAGFGASVLVGYVVWAFRGTSLLLGALSAMPMWRCFDPLPVLIGNDKKRDKDGEENDLEEEKRVRDILDSE